MLQNGATCQAGVLDVLKLGWAVYAQEDMKSKEQVMQELNLDSLPDNEFMELYQFASTQRTHEARVGRITAGEMTPHEMAQTVQADLGAPREPK